MIRHRETFNGNGILTTFSVTTTIDPHEFVQTMVYLAGVLQSQALYTLSTTGSQRNTNLVFNVAPGLGILITIVVFA